MDVAQPVYIWELSTYDGGANTGETSGRFHIHSHGIDSRIITSTCAAPSYSCCRPSGNLNES